MDLSKESRAQLQKACETLGVEFTQRDDVIPAMILAITERLAVLVAALSSKAKTGEMPSLNTPEIPADLPPAPRPPPVHVNIPDGKTICKKCNGAGSTTGDDGVKWGCDAAQGGCNGYGYV